MRRHLLILALLALLVWAPAHAANLAERATSPGALSGAHNALEGRCTACHVPLHRAAEDRQCGTCHRGVAHDIASRTRWHGLIPAARSQPCRTCHTEHRGAQTALVLFDRHDFVHDRDSAYRLTGGHARVRCAACHAGMDHFREAPQACAACHARADVHRGGLGPQCAACHTTARWKQVLPFDHDRTRYPLTGAHRTTACMGCHVGQRWRGTPTACVACHARADVHRGADGPACATCHLTTVWRAIRFDHDGVRAFRLNGAHRVVPCTGCHAVRARPAAAPVACVGCHLKDDVHRNADGPKCADCHGETTWKVAKFDHARTVFPLTGLHARVACVACHPRSVDTVRVGTRCVDCHLKDDVHRASLGDRCERCHKVTGWPIAGLPRIAPLRPAKPRRAGDFPRSGVQP